jgi:outer membrane biogenesis lipoprotein LolB
MQPKTILIGLLAVVSLVLGACATETGQKAADVNNTLSEPEHVNQAPQDGGLSSTLSSPEHKNMSTEPQGPGSRKP